MTEEEARELREQARERYRIRCRKAQQVYDDAVLEAWDSYQREMAQLPAEQEEPVR